MKEKIHPEYVEITVTCVCGNSFTTRSTMGKSFHVEICSECHPFFTGKQKLVDSAGRVDRFIKKYGDKAARDAAAEGRAQAAESKTRASGAPAAEPAPAPGGSKAPAPEASR